MSASPYKQLEQEFKRLHAFRGALALLRWDAAVMMPRGSADVRGEQLAALETEHHALLDRAAHHAAARSGAGQHPGTRGLADREPARDAPPARPRHRHARDAGGATDQGDFARRVALARGPRREQVRGLCALSGRGRAPGARQGGTARPGAESGALRCAGGRVQPRAHDARYRRHVQGDVAPPALAHPRIDRRPGRASAAATHRQVHRRQAAHAGGRGDEGRRLSLRSRPAGRE